MWLLQGTARAARREQQSPISLSRARTSLCRASVTTEHPGLALVLPRAEGPREGTGDPKCPWLPGGAERDSPCFPTCAPNPDCPHLAHPRGAKELMGSTQPRSQPFPARAHLPLSRPRVPEGSRLHSRGMGMSCSQLPYPILILHIPWGTSVRPPGATNTIPPSQPQSQGDPTSVTGTTQTRVSHGPRGHQDISVASDTPQPCPALGDQAVTQELRVGSPSKAQPTPLWLQNPQRAWLGQGNGHRRQKPQELGSPGRCRAPATVTLSPWFCHHHDPAPS